MTRLDYGFDQNIGISGKQIQEDVVRVSTLQTAAGLNLTVGLVAEGESAYDKGQRAAQQVASRIWRSLKEATETDMNKLLVLALQRANQALRREIEQDGRSDLMAASVTLAIIYQNRLYMGHQGHTCAYLVRGERVFPLTDARESGRLGLPEPLLPWPGLQFAPELTLAADKGILLKRGDHLVLCSDGLIKERPDNKGAFLNPQTEMAAILNKRNTPALETARTLVSLAVGRRADDNVSVVVMSMPLHFNWFVWPVGAIFLVALSLVLGTLWLWQRPLLPNTAPVSSLSSTAASPAAIATVLPTPLPQRVDIAVRGVTGEVKNFLEGEETVVVNGIVPMTIHSTIRTGNQSRVRLGLPSGADLLLGANTAIQLVAVPGATGEVEPLDGPLRTIIQLQQGELLLDQASEQANNSYIFDENNQLLVSLAGSGTVALSKKPGSVQVVCYAGSCYLLAAVELLDVMGEAMIWPDQPIQFLPPQTVQFVSYADWQEQCRCLPK